MIKILFVTQHNPFANSFGAEQRAHVLMRAALNCGCEVDIAYISAMPTAIPGQLPAGVRVVMHGHPDTRGKGRLRELTDRLGANVFMTDKQLAHNLRGIMQAGGYDYVMCRYIACAQRVGLRPYAHKLILDIDDLPSQAVAGQLRQASNHRTIFRTLAVPVEHILKWRTRQWVKDSLCTFLPNKAQADAWGTDFLPNIPVVSVSEPHFEGGTRNILFIGLLSYKPNSQAIAQFADTVLPKITQKVPEAKLIVAGKGLPKEIADKWQNRSDIQALGFVENLHDFYQMGNIVICPVNVGGGTNIKVVEAMAMGKACVMSRFGMEGFETFVHDGTNAFVADNDDEFAGKCIALLQDDTLCARMQKEAHEGSMRYYSQSTIDNLLAAKLGGRNA